jgi:hypothetical protein
MFIQMNTIQMVSKQLHQLLINPIFKSNSFGQSFEEKTAAILFLKKFITGGDTDVKNKCGQPKERVHLPRWCWKKKQFNGFG